MGCVDVRCGRMQEACFGGWRWVYSSLLKGMVHEPSAAKIAEWRENLKEVVKGHVKGSRPSLAVKVTQHAKTLARESKQVSGKWMVFDKPMKNITEAQWDKVKEAVAAGKLGPVAKLAVGAPPGRVMCIYTYSFLDEDDVWRVLKNLQTMGVHPTSWKADFVTHVGLSSKKRFQNDMLHVPNFQSGWFLPREMEGFTKRKLNAAEADVDMTVAPPHKILI